MTSAYKINLIETVVNSSEANDWKSAVVEWSIDDVEEDRTQTVSCICGHTPIRYLFTIRNIVNGNKLCPIGSTCIMKFERPDLNEEVSTKEQLYQLFHAIEDNTFLTLSPDFFSRKLLRNLFDLGAFKPSHYNDFQPHKDYDFMLKMFNKRKERTDNENKKVAAIILNSIKPFLQEILKIRRCG